MNFCDLWPLIIAMMLRQSPDRAQGSVPIQVINQAYFRCTAGLVWFTVGAIFETVIEPSVV